MVFIALSTFIYMYSILEVPDPDQVIDVKDIMIFYFLIIFLNQQLI